ncbi:Ankyrin repeat domain-containing protein 44 [Aspergillus nanangensis]|uniref:Ankyrin repeat domain-containing protein 44 n=1 Tax=Aspergillus nanangensis TaxID=2582783 RepID=A0AAD4D079_ASPNN|nr:Ankyrin repeat domain-containing protein 44 [Aspergillus nanangensis]
MATDSQLFLQAATTGDLSTIETLYLHNPTLLTVKDGPTGRTALHLATLHGHTELLERLLAYNINLSLADTQGQTALHIAAQQSSSTIVKALLKRSADQSIRDRQGRTPLFYAYQNASPEVLGCFLDYSPAYESKMQCGLTPEIILRAGAGRKWTPMHVSVGSQGL